MIQFECLRSLADFYRQDKNALAVGPVGSGKSTALLRKIVRAAEAVEPESDGVRKSACVIVRNTTDQLADTVVPDMHKALPMHEFGQTLKFAPAEDGWDCVLSYTRRKSRWSAGGTVVCKIMLRPCGAARDLDRLNALHLSFACMEEFREIDPEVFHILRDRVGRFPFGRGAVWGVSNVPDFDSPWWHVINAPRAHVPPEFYTQPSGLWPPADWKKFLRDGYYEDLVEAHKGDEAWIDTFVHARVPSPCPASP